MNMFQCNMLPHNWSNEWHFEDKYLTAIVAIARKTSNQKVSIHFC